MALIQLHNLHNQTTIHWSHIATSHVLHNGLLKYDCQMFAAKRRVYVYGGLLWGLSCDILWALAFFFVFFDILWSGWPFLVVVARWSCCVPEAARNNFDTNNTQHMLHTTVCECIGHIHDIPLHTWNILKSLNREKFWAYRKIQSLRNKHEVCKSHTVF